MSSWSAAARPPVVIVAGPTASGKSALAVSLAQHFGGVIVNADSMQIYRDLRILTARPAPEDEAKAPHRLYGVLPAVERCSAGRWRALAVAEIRSAHARGLLPIVTGGTGLYLRALAAGIAPVPQIPGDIRAAAEKLYRQLGGAGFHAALARIDPVMAARLPPQDRQRLLRAWEVVTATGRSLADWQQDSGQSLDEFRFIVVSVLPPRARLYAACDARFTAMLAQGALEEARALLAKRLDPGLPVMKALGLRELGRHLAGEIALDEAARQAQVATRRYAKRQMTWLRHQKFDNFITIMEVSEILSKSLEAEIFNNIRLSLLTPPE